MKPFWIQLTALCLSSVLWAQPELHIDFNDQWVGSPAGEQPMFRNEGSGNIQWATLQRQTPDNADEDKQDQTEAEESSKDHFNFVPNGRGGTALGIATTAKIDEYMVFGPLEYQEGVMVLELAARFDGSYRTNYTWLEDRDPLDGQKMLYWGLDELGRMNLQLDKGRVSIITQALELPRDEWISFQVIIDPQQTGLHSAIQCFKNGEMIDLNEHESVYSPFHMESTGAMITSLRRDKAAKLEVDYLRITMNHSNPSPFDFYGGERYIQDGAAIALIAPGAYTMRRTRYSLKEIENMSLAERTTKRLDESLYDRHDQGHPGVFHGVFEINLALESAAFDELVQVEVYAQKPGDAWKKILEASTSLETKDPHSGLTWIHRYWDARQAHLDWSEADAQTPYRSDSGIRLKFSLR